MDLLFTTKHLTAIMIAVLVIAVVIYIFKKLNLENRKLIIWTAIIFYVFEFFKQGYWIVTGVFTVQKLPLYPCNMPLYVMPFLIFGNHKIREFLKPFVYVIFIGGGVLTLMYPSIILGTSTNWTLDMSNFVPFISVIAHATMIAVGIYLLMSGYYKIRKHDYLRILIVIFIMFLITYVFNKTFGTDFFFSNYGKGLPSFFQDLKQFNEFLFASLVFIVGLSVLYISYWTTLLVNKYNDNRFSI